MTDSWGRLASLKEMRLEEGYCLIVDSSAFGKLDFWTLFCGW